MEQLKRNECGQFSDDRADQIKEDIEKALLPVIEKWNTIDAMDIENIILHTIPYFFMRNITLKNANVIMKEKGYSYSEEMKMR